MLVLTPAVRACLTVLPYNGGKAHSAFSTGNSATTYVRLIASKQKQQVACGDTSVHLGTLLAWLRNEGDS